MITLDIAIGERFRLYSRKTEEFYGENHLGNRNVFYIAEDGEIRNIDSPISYSILYPEIINGHFEIIPVKQFVF